MPRDGKIQVLHEDAHLLFVNKPARMLTVPPPKGQGKNKGPSLAERLADEGRTLLPVHRIDFETSGVVVFAKDEGTLDAMIELFRAQSIEKSYLALVNGWLQPASGVLEYPIRDMGASAIVSQDGDAAVTRYWTKSQHGPCTLLKVKIDTGRHNQIRVHFAHIGHPLVGERKYALGKEGIIKAGRVMLHAQSIAFQPPHLSHLLRISAPMPEDFEQAVTLADEWTGELKNMAFTRALTRPKPAAPQRKKSEVGRGGTRHFRGRRR